MKSESSVMPAAITKEGTNHWLAKDIELVTRTNHMDTTEYQMYEYNIIMVTGYSDTFVAANFDNFFIEPEKYNVRQLNSVYYKSKTPEFVVFQMAQYADFVQVNDVVDTLVMDGLATTETVDALVLDNLSLTEVVDTLVLAGLEV
jgi:hypothetical protein